MTTENEGKLGSSIKSKAGRVYALDAWRASLLLLGVVLHSMSDIVHSMPESIVKVSFIRLIDLIHTFRMPAFFLLSGYLGALLYDLRGLSEFLKNRLLRIGIPFVVFVPLIGGLLAFLGTLASYVYSYQEDPLSQALSLSIYAHPWWLMSLNHLWFLWHLILILGTFIVGWPLALKLQGGRLLAGIARLGRYPVWFAVLASGGAVAYGFYFRWDSLPTDNTWFPTWDILGFYALAYWSGAIIYLARVRLDNFQRGWGLCLVAAIVSVALRYFDSKHGRVFPWSQNGMLFEGYVLTQALACVGLTVGSLGLYLRFFSRESRIWRYLSDSAYWVYLVHLPLALHLPSLWERTELPIEVYPLLTLVGTLLVSYVSYDCLYFLYNIVVN